MDPKAPNHTSFHPQCSGRIRGGSSSSREPLSSVIMSPFVRSRQLTIGTECNALRPPPPLHPDPTRHRGRNPQGGIEQDWQTIGTRWAAIEPLRARALFDALQIQSQVTHRTWMRYFDGLQSTDRIKFGQRIFYIDAIGNIDERKRELEMFCIEVA